MSERRGMAIFGEVSGSRLSPVTLELLGAGRRLADARGELVSLILVAGDGAACAAEAIARGADRVCVVPDPPADHYEGASYTAIIAKLCTETLTPALLLFGQTAVGRDLAPRVAFRLTAGLVTDCIRLEASAPNGPIFATKPISGGNVLATYALGTGSLQVASLRRRAMEPLSPDASRTGETVSVPCGVDASAVRVRLVERIVQEAGAGPALETADIVVTGGRGLENAQEFDSYITKGLAAALGAAVGGTRGAVDAGLVPETQQVGLTGKVVGPNLYVAIGLSGAIQHMAGCSGAKNIVAVNIDENAQIFKFAKFGIVGDYKQVVPALIEKLREGP